MALQEKISVQKLSQLNTDNLLAVFPVGPLGICVPDSTAFVGVAG